ncbi:MAG TPA: hypothetical protein VE994_03355 [Terriglobales bacterium]|nr:hypothetical protein [Terriglobales bacterium]
MMLPDLRAIELELMQFGFRRVTYVGLYCSRDGYWRAAIEASEEEPPRALPCPKCECSVRAEFLARGFSRKALPIFEQVVRATVLDDMSADEPRRAPIFRKPRKIEWRRGALRQFGR